MTQASVQALPGGTRRGRWQRPPLARGWPRLRYALTLGLVCGLPPDANLLARVPVPFPPVFVIGFVSIVGIEMGYGLAVIATSRGGRVGSRLWAGLPFTANPLARLWWGLAFVVGAPVGYATGYATGLLWPAASATPGIAWGPLWAAGTVASAGCLLLSAACSNTEVKRSIRSGRAPQYRISSDRLWWWDGDGWASVMIAAPVGALRSPDGTHWWSGEGWVPLPPRPGRR